MFEPGALPISGSTLVALALYAGASLYAGQIVGGRSIDKSGWPAQCEAGIKAEIRESTPPRQVLPPTDCSSVFGVFHPEVARFCEKINNPDFGGPAAQAEREAERHRREMQDRRRARAAANAINRCDCARGLYLRERMIALGLYAGSARLVSLPSIDGMARELGQALATPHCSALPGTVS